MKHVTDRTSNPFGMRPPFDRSEGGSHAAVFGYGDANADFHVIGDHPGVHGGTRTGVPFTETDAGEAVQELLRTVEFADGPADRPRLENCFCSYLHMCTLPGGRTPTAEEYDELERFFDAELRAINAHVLLPVGERATDHVLTEYTTQRPRLDVDMSKLHARELRGRGFMVIPLADPSSWSADGRAAAEARLAAVLRSDYRQTKGVATLVG
ncbi:uracil-DNA glycosylase family protein [Halovivax sp.]|uniref:uracil-DNA glycosylase family protein n=1 Tax=Halovivax sp. TaxID=1935978 RepID=UPI0025BA7456|nr:uracil-DNA glycosylase family protein [Halovivax sp.]